MKTMYKDFGKSLIDPKYCCCGMSLSYVSRTELKLMDSCTSSQFRYILNTARTGGKYPSLSWPTAKVDTDETGRSVSYRSDGLCDSFWWVLLRKI
jgi:hypothetical protein